MLAVVTLAVGAPTLAASPMPDRLPGGGTSVAPGAPGTAPLPIDPPVVTPAPVTAPAVAPAPPGPPAPGLRLGARGSDVRALQRRLRVRGIRVPVNGTYGRVTRAGVRILQRRMGLEATGIANAALLGRLGVRIRAVASAPPPPPSAVTATYLKAFPVVGDYSYSDDFGAPRGQGPHQGNDIMGQMGMPLVACVDATISRLTRTESGLGGIWIWFVDAQGNEYYYAHMESISPELRAGSQVTTGQVVGTMGMTGDARGTTPHLHFEIRPSGGGSINPFSDLRAVDPRK